MAHVFAEPIKTFRFIVEFEKIVTGSVKSNETKNGNAENDGRYNISAAYTQFSGVRMRVETVNMRSGSEARGVVDLIPALTNFENVKLSKGVIGDNEFLDWIFAAAPAINVAATGKELVRNINVVALDDKGERAVTWTLIDAMPVAYELGEMDSTQSSVLSETVEFAIGGFRRETHIPEEAKS